MASVEGKEYSVWYTPEPVESGKKTEKIYKQRDLQAGTGDESQSGI